VTINRTRQHRATPDRAHRHRPLPGPEITLLRFDDELKGVRRAN